jgi:hypothetical protein
MVMQKPRMVPAFFAAVSLGALGLVGCASMPPPPTGSGDLEVRHTAPVVMGNAFQCSGMWPSDLTPCGYAWASQPATQAISGTSSDMVELLLHRTPIPVDGGASMVYLKLKFAGDGTTSASAEEMTTAAGTVRVIEMSAATSGFVDPAIMGRTPDVRNAGKFSLTFPWGSISGTYDTAQ